MELHHTKQQSVLSFLSISNLCSFLLCSATFLFIISMHIIHKRKRELKFKGKKLPPGSLGLPILGETMDFFTPSSSFDIHPFIKMRMIKYGSVFKTSLVGRPLVVSADPVLNQLVFQQEGKMFESWYPISFAKIFGQENASELHGPKFKFLKSLFLKLLGSPNLRNVLIQDVEKEAVECLQKWSAESSVELRAELSSMIFNVVAKKLISNDPSTAPEDLKKNFSDFINGLISFPLNIPGTAYHKCLKGRKNVMSILRRLLSERKSSPPREECPDYLDFVVKELRNDSSMLTEGMALDLVFALLYASSETPAPALCLAVKFLADNSKVLEELTEEHEAIIRNRKDPNSGITWAEYKSMKFTFHVINETVRLANVAPVIFRRALMDITIKEYTIPAGWGVMICPPASHLNPNIYEEPLKFNPWRWKDKPEINVGTKDFMPFGGGMRLCVGTEFTKVEMAIFLHCLVTKYRWKTIRGGNTLRTPGLKFSDGYHIQIFSK